MQSVILKLLFITTGLFSLFIHAEEAQWEWDFDHKMHFLVKSLNEKNYVITVKTREISSTNINNINKENKKKGKYSKSFDRGAALLFRKSLSLCNGYNYTLEVLSGVSGVNDYKERSNFIPRDLKAKLTCL